MYMHMHMHNPPHSLFLSVYDTSIYTCSHAFIHTYFRTTGSRSCMGSRMTSSVIMSPTRRASVIMRLYTTYAVTASLEGDVCSRPLYVCICASMCVRVHTVTVCGGGPSTNVCIHACVQVQMFTYATCVMSATLGRNMHAQSPCLSVCLEYAMSLRPCVCM
jgi:hypothetical protein